MDREEFERCQTMLGLILRCLADLPMEEYQETLRSALEIGVFFDPTGWIRGSKAVEENAEIARAFRPAWDLAKKLQAGIEKTGG